MIQNKTIGQHIADLNKVFLFNISFLFVSFIFLFPIAELFLRKILLNFNIPLYAYSLMENINVTLATAITFAILLTIPMVTISILRFAEIRMSKKYILLAISMYLTGIFGFYIGFQYFSSYMATQIYAYQLVETAVSLSSVMYFALINGVLIAIALELVYILPILTKIGLISYKKLKKARPYLFTLLLIAIAWITPSTDFISLGLLLIPTYGGFEGGLQISRFFGDTKKC